MSYLLRNGIRAIVIIHWWDSQTTDWIYLLDPGQAGSKIKIQKVFLDLKNETVAVWILQAFD